MQMAGAGGMKRHGNEEGFEKKAPGVFLISQDEGGKERK